MKSELLDRLTGHDRDDARRLGDVDLDSRDEPLDLDGTHDSAEAIPSRERLLADRAAQALDLGRRDDAPVRRIPLDVDLAVTIPAPKRLDADPERSCGLTPPTEFA